MKLHVEFSGLTKKGNVWAKIANIDKTNAEGASTLVMAFVHAPADKPKIDKPLVSPQVVEGTLLYSPPRTTDGEEQPGMYILQLS